MWQTPKTNWSSKDFFNIKDYNRIKSNIEEIKSQAILLWPEFDIQDMGEDKSYQDYSFYADEINLFEENLELLTQHTFAFQIGEKQVFYENQPFIGYEELNRIENACKIMYENMIGGIEGRRRMKFKLKGDKF